MLTRAVFSLRDSRTRVAQLAHQLEWGFHMARVNCLSWAPDSIHLASGSLDTAIIVWDASHPAKHITYKSTCATLDADS